MITNTAAIDIKQSRENLIRVESKEALGAIAMQSLKIKIIGLALCCFGLSTGKADMTVTAWNPVFKGIDHATGTNQPDATYPSLNVMHVLRVDLSDPDIQIITSPKLTNNYLANSRETGGYTVSDFQKRHDLQVSINAGLFDPSSYYLPAGTPMDIHGLSIDRGVLVSPANSVSAASLIFSASNAPELIYTNWPARSTNSMYNVVSGDYCVLVKGVNTGYQYRNDGDFIHQVNPRTAFGISQDKRYLYLMTIDGRQPGYSDGAWDFETGAWLIKMGAYDGVNLDGGGSTTMVIEDSTGQPVRLNSSSAVADSGKERTVGSHFGVYAKPVVGFINDVVATPEDVSATITWTTPEPATGQVEYGTDPGLGLSSPLTTAVVTNHTATLSDLIPSTTYYYQIKSAVNASEYKSPLLVFTTTNYVTTNVVFDITNSWKYSWANLDGVNWTAPTYNDSTSSWNPPGQGILWADARGPNDAINPKNTQMSIDTSTAFPYPTYYFRTHFNLPSISTGTSLIFSAHVDDGAVFYLNGTEIYRLRMPASPQEIVNSDLAAAAPCPEDNPAGNATCSDDFEVSPSVLQGVVKAGDNVLAVEVHNYNPRSPDITFGTSLAATVPIPKDNPTLHIAYSDGQITIAWQGTGFRLQQSASVTGGWSNVPGSIASPYTTTASGQAQFFRLGK
jgi:exopolysaccharide biosynthesis protein